MSKLDLYNQITYMESYFKEESRAFLNFQEKVFNEIFYFKKKIMRSCLISNIKNTGLVDIDDGAFSKACHVFDLDIEEVTMLQSYSRYNPFIWMRIANRKFKKIKQVDYEYRNKFKKLLTVIEDIERDLEVMNLKEKENDHLTAFLRIKPKILEMIDFKQTEMGDFKVPLLLAFAGNWKMKRNDILSLISLDPRGETSNYIIEELPEEIDYKTFHDVITSLTPNKPNLTVVN